jgi:hypothetical protein
MVVDQIMKVGGKYFHIAPEVDLSRKLQATHCVEAPSWTGRRFVPSGER